MIHDDDLPAPDVRYWPAGDIEAGRLHSCPTCGQSTPLPDPAVTQPAPSTMAPAVPVRCPICYHGAASHPVSMVAPVAGYVRPTCFGRFDCPCEHSYVDVMAMVGL